MPYSRLLAGVLCLLLTSIAARADLFVVSISTRTYSINGKGEVIFRAGNQRQFIDQAVESDTSTNLNAKALVLAYDTDADALEVVRKADGTLISTVMTFSSGLDIKNAGQTREYRQAFITLNGESGPTGSVDGKIDIVYDHKNNITAYRWNGDMQYSIAGDQNSPNRVVHAVFSVGRSVNAKSIP